MGLHFRPNPQPEVGRVRVENRSVRRFARAISRTSTEGSPSRSAGCWRVPNCAVISETLCAQERPQFEVASIKPFLPAPGVGRGGGGCTPFKMDRGRVDMCATLATAIGYAYRIPRSRILGPDWLTGRTAKTLTATLRTLQEVFAE